MSELNQTADFIKLLTSHQLALRGFIISMLPGSQDVNDVLQDTNVVLWEKMKSFKPGTNFQAWSFAIARNKVMQYWGHQRKLHRLVLGEETLLAVAEAKQAAPPETIERKLTALGKCLERLSPSERDLVDARYRRGSSLEKYSDEAGRSAASLRVTLYRVRNKLRQCIEKTLVWEGGRA
ncbi:MAG: sigma-70 family RNA polymerase sigma factor [Akkermansiaceae bacterium]|nr:sigma-70 family RNA polymerase sigma factor [Akkermansiaceae bacterium]